MHNPLNLHLALEMAMQDVMDNMAELSLDFGFAEGEACFEILAIEPAEVPDLAPDAAPAIRSPFSASIYTISCSQRRMAV